jgi:hypothetical protein
VCGKKEDGVEGGKGKMESKVGRGRWSVKEWIESGEEKMEKRRWRRNDGRRVGRLK